MNKEEILEKLGDGFNFDIHFYSNAGRRDLADFILYHAKQQSIEFSQWCRTNFKADEDYNDQWIVGSGKSNTTEQLYNLFINQKENNPPQK